MPHPKKPTRYRGDFQILNPQAAGIDVSATFHVVAVPPDAQGFVEVRSFGTCTVDLEALADWLTQNQVTTVAMESTGVYWIALYDLLESKGFEVLLVDPRQIQRAPGRPKTDKEDAQWIRRLHSVGLLRSAFRPDEGIRVLRCYMRQRANQVRYASNHIQHMQKALEQMNVKLTEAVSDITGKTGLSIIRAILAGQRDPRVLAKLRDFRCKQDETQIARALQGTWRVEHLFELKQAMEVYDFYQKQILACDEVIEAQLKNLEPPEASDPPPPAPKGRRKSGKQKVKGPNFDARKGLYRVTGVDLTAIEGIGEATALVVLSEIGTDIGRWGSSKQFCAWLGLCPQVKQSGLKVLSSRVRPGPNRAAQALRQAANSLQSSQSALGSFFRRIAARSSRVQAVTATAHKLARLVYALLKHGQAYVAVGQEAYEAAHKERQLRVLHRKARELGYEVKERERTPQA